MNMFDNFLVKQDSIKYWQTLQDDREEELECSEPAEEVGK